MAAFLEQGDFRSADVKKMPQPGYYRARLDKENRLLFRIGEYQGEKYLFILLDKILSFDEEQEAVFHAPPPLIIISSAGSGKTALTL